MEQDLYSFLKNCLDVSRPVLLGLSGGADSMALFHLLCHYREQNPEFRFSVAHIDHRWREESKKEAEILEQMAKTLNIAYHLKVLDPLHIKGNLEAACRKLRHQFFKDLCAVHGYQAVLLGHHADDQAETVLKKLFEGASLPLLTGISSVSKIESLIIWRPLIKISKKRIVDWLNSNNKLYFEDITNKDVRYLRARMRETIIPDLSSMFGKEVRASLCRIGEEAQELKKYFESTMSNTIQNIKKGPFGACLDLRKELGRSDIEIKFLLRKLCELKNFTLSHNLVKKALKLLKKNAANKKLQMCGFDLYIDRGVVFLLYKKLEVLPESEIVLKHGEKFGPWEICLESGSQSYVERSDWSSVWEGELFVSLPLGNYQLKKGVPSLRLATGSTLDKWWNKKKIPALLRSIVPVICQNNKVEHEFLTGYKCGVVNSSEPKIFLSLRYRG